MAFLGFLTRRILWGILTLLLLSVLTFMFAFLVPADPARVLAGQHATPDQVAVIRHELHLDQPKTVQYVYWIGRVLQGNWGNSYNSNEPVMKAIKRYAPYTLYLALAAIFFELLLGIPVGVVAATRQYSLLDSVLMVLALIGISLPVFVVGVLMLFVFGFKLSWFPMNGWHGIISLVLPGMTLGITGAAQYARLLRSSMLEVKRLDYVRTARAKGLGSSAVTWKHVVRNALIPVATMIGLDFGGFMGGVIITESVFAYPGIGDLAYNSISNLDIPVIMGTVLFSAFFVVVGNLLADATYATLDPRITYE